MGSRLFEQPSNEDFGDYSTIKDDEHTIFDVTRLLPLWALVVRPSSNFHSKSNSPTSAAYLHRDIYTNRPHLIGRRPGVVELSLVATLGDVQPLTKLQIEVVDSDLSPINRQKSNNLDIVAIKAECVVRLILFEYFFCLKIRYTYIYIIEKNNLYFILCPTFYDFLFILKV